jgi:hypothetical protein
MNRLSDYSDMNGFYYTRISLFVLSNKNNFMSLKIFTFLWYELTFHIHYFFCLISSVEETKPKVKAAFII